MHRFTCCPRNSHNWTHFDWAKKYTISLEQTLRLAGTGSQQGSFKYLIQVWFNSCSHSQNSSGPRKGNIAQHSPQLVAWAQLPTRDRKTIEALCFRSFVVLSLGFTQDWFLSAGKGKTLSSQHWFQEDAYLGCPSLQSWLLKGESWGHSSMGCSDAPTSEPPKAEGGAKHR